MASKNTEILLGAKTKAIIEASGDTQTEAAKKLGLSVPGLGSITQNRVKNTSYEVLIALVNEYDVDLLYLVDNDIPVLPIRYGSSKERMKPETDENKAFYDLILTTKGLKEIVFNLLKIPPKHRKAIGDMIATLAEKDEN
ncbi:helix-turn-helix domain-containing protein [Leptospira sp. id769339]|uniref:helix-turn-helix domain-containing protein n=1 Tax=Leptospira sp. id769339 TaxID=2864221 RepID=UPI00214BE138|nr:helix-turn-helix transcriptional regulator [Leptospira sp. id769339]MCR1795633.1 helix-turn-helix domain-containing protein [Leptospira sp. id769339]